jgi:hypothetical protein
VLLSPRVELSLSPLGEPIVRKFSIPITQWDAVEDYVHASMKAIADKWLELSAEHFALDRPLINDNGSIGVEHQDMKATSS